jgi:mycothiol synthase
VDLPAGYTYRPATPADGAACADLVIAVDVEEYGEPDYEEADVHESWARDRFDLARDTSLVHGPDGALVGYAQVWDKRPHELLHAELAVHPDAPDLYPWLVAALSARAQEHAQESGRATAHPFGGAPNARRAAALRDAGYEVVRVFRRMTADLTQPPPPPPEAPGVTIRVATPDELPTFHALYVASFADHFDFVAEPYDAWRPRFVAEGTYYPAYWWLAEVDGTPAGFLVGQRHEQDGWVKSLGVVPRARRRRAAAALLATAFDAFRRDGAPRVGLGVDSDNVTGAMAVYERAGMQADRRYDCYERVFTRS